MSTQQLLKSYMMNDGLDEVRGSATIRGRDRAEVVLRDDSEGVVVVGKGNSLVRAYEQARERLFGNL